MISKTADQVFESLACRACHVAHATARQPARLQASLWFTEVGRYLSLLNDVELARARQHCGFLSETGWQTLSKTLEILNGPIKSSDDEHPVQTLQQPSINAQGWVRIFRSTHAALPMDGLDAEVMVKSAFRHAHLDLDSQDWVRGIWGLPPAAPITLEGLKEAILASDLFSAPWMVAVWTPDNQWVVEGIAGTYLRKEADASNPIFTDLLTLQRGDQVAKIDKYGVVVPGTGPSLGIQTVISSVDLALRLGYRLDLLPTHFYAPVDSWEDGVAGFSESPLMGVALLSEGRRWLLRFRRDHDRWRAEGLILEDLPTIRNLVGFDASVPLDVSDIERLLAKGKPIWARIPSLLRVWG